MANDRIIVFDTEATSLIPGQICQISCLILENGRITGKNYFFTVDEMDESSQEVHGMSMEMLEELSGGERFEDRADELFSDFSGAKLIIGHNVAADDKYIRVEFERLGIKLPRINTFCTMNYFTGIMNLARKQRNGRPKPPRLCELEEYYGLDGEFVAQKSAEWFGGGGAEHDARYDTAATYLCLVKATEKGDLRGIL